MIGAFLFDMDGVILHSNPFHREAWEQFNRGYGLETTPEMHGRMYGRHNRQIVRDFYGDVLTDEEVDARGRAKEEIYRAILTGRVDEVLVLGLRDFLIRHQKSPMAVATNAEPENVRFVLEESGIRRYFGAIVDGHQVSRPKPHPDIYLRAADLLAIEPGSCVVFEDSPAGVAAGVAAGMRVIGLLTTYDDLPGTVLTIDNFLSGDLEEWIEAQSRLI